MSSSPTSAAPIFISDLDYLLRGIDALSERTATDLAGLVQSVRRLQRDIAVLRAEALELGAGQAPGKTALPQPKRSRELARHPRIEAKRR